MKFCPGCRRHKPWAEFYRNRAMRDGLTRICKTCHKDYAKTRHRNYEMHATDLRRYGLRRADVVRITADQGGGCAICGRPPGGRNKYLDIDHDHTTGAVRGLLCPACNRGLGMFDEDPARLRAAAIYLEAARDLRTIRPLPLGS